MRKRIIIFATLLLCSVAMWAQTFTVDGITYKVTSTNPMEVQVGTGGYGSPAIDNTITGAIDIPSSVTDSDDNNYLVTSIGRWAFYGCSGLTSVTIPNSVTSIGSSAFSGCSGITSISIPNNVTNIGWEAFSYCSGLTSIVVESGNMVYDSRENCNAIIETSSNTLHMGCKCTTIPNSVTSIGDYALWDCSGLTSIIIPKSVTSIGELAFHGCI